MCLWDAAGSAGVVLTQQHFPRVDVAVHLSQGLDFLCHCGVIALLCLALVLFSDGLSQDLLDLAIEVVLPAELLSLFFDIRRLIDYNHLRPSVAHIQLDLEPAALPFLLLL